MTKWVLQLFYICVAIFALIACNSESPENGETETESNGGKINIVSTIAQIGEPIEVIGGERVEVTSLMGPGVDPHLYEATQGDISSLDQAEIIFYNGLNLEGNMEEIFEQMKKSKTTVALGESLSEDQLLEDEDGAIDPHIWFDIDLWKVALEAAVETLKEHSPDDAEYFEGNKEAYFEQLDELKEYAVETLNEIPEKQRVLVTAHDAFGYFGAMYHIDVVGLQGLSTEDEVGISDIQSTVDLLIDKQIPAVFVESSINENTIQAVIDGAKESGLDVSLGGELYSDAMGEQDTEEGTYLGMYRHNVDTIYTGLTKGEN